MARTRNQATTPATDQTERDPSQPTSAQRRDQQARRALALSQFNETLADALIAEAAENNVSVQVVAQHVVTRIVELARGEGR